jgi:DNA-dependent RNA polymerase auxiliary subunit epsilon
MSKAAKIAVVEFFIIGLMIFCYFYFLRPMDAENWRETIDSLATLNEQSLERSNTLEQEKSVLKVEFKGYIDSVDTRQIEYDENKIQFNATSDFITSSSDTAYARYVTARKIPPGYFD